MPKARARIQDSFFVVQQLFSVLPDGDRYKRDEKEGGKNELSFSEHICIFGKGTYKSP